MRKFPELIGRIENGELQKQLWKLMVSESPFEKVHLNGFLPILLRK